MSSIRRQSIISSLVIYIGFAVGLLNTYLFAKEGIFLDAQFGLYNAFIAIATMMMGFANLAMPSFIHKFYLFSYLHIYINVFRLDLAGPLMGGLFRMLFKKLTKEVTHFKTHSTLLFYISNNFLGYFPFLSVVISFFSPSPHSPLSLSLYVPFLPVILFLHFPSPMTPSSPFSIFSFSPCQPLPLPL